jgi:hypothetical protein
MNISASPPITAAVTPQNNRSVTAEEQGKAPTKEAHTTATETSFSKAQIASALTETEIKQVQDLKTRDREVRAHEAAHLSAAGSLAQSGASYSYQRGPDGVQYAVGGEVHIDTSAVAGDPETTLAKSQRIRAAALAPAQPSSQDLNVAAQAAQLAVQARAEISQLQRAEPANKTAPNGDETDSIDGVDGDANGDEDRTNNIVAEQQIQAITDSSLITNDAAERLLDLIA